MIEVTLGSSEDGVVFNFLPSDSTWEWRDIPGFSNHQASNGGLVRHRKYIGQRLSLGVYRVPTTIGSYLRSGTLSDDQKKRSSEVHTLVCLAFHGLPPASLGPKPEVNHIDGNKHNNIPGNLEWSNRSLNIKHAYLTGLNRGSVRIYVTDHRTGGITAFHAISAVAEAFEVERTRMDAIIRKHKETLWQDRYTFSKDYSSRTRTDSMSMKYVKLKNYMTGEVSVVDCASAAEDVSRVDAGTIHYRLAHKDVSLINGYVFMEAKDTNDFPNHSKDEAQQSLEYHQNKTKSREKRFGITAKNYITGEITTYSGLAHLATDLKLSRGTVRWLMRERLLQLYHGYYFQHTEFLEDWPKFTKEYSELSVRMQRVDGDPISVTDLKLDTTKLYASKGEFAREIGVFPTVFTSWAKANPGKAYKNRWLTSAHEIKLLE